jgi:hypothetical protein
LTEGDLKAAFNEDGYSTETSLTPCMQANITSAYNNWSEGVMQLEKTQKYLNYHDVEHLINGLTPY